MRRKLLICVMLLMTGLAFGQTQQGVVKTKGRMVNGKHVAGKGLSNATVTIQGRSAVLSQANGAFSFPVTAKTFMVSSVQKNGYQLVDADATRKAYQYSPNTFYLVMETPEQQMDDLLEAQKKISSTLRQQLKNAHQEIQRLKDENRISEEEYQKRLQQLYDDQKNNEKMIADMAKEYSQIDYDQLDELNRQISEAILNGELTKADSLLRTKGDINSRIAEVRKAQQIEAEREKEIARQQKELAASQEGTRKKLEDLAQDCKNYFDRYKMSNQHDSAAYYIELRAELDTTDASWQFDAAYYCQEQNQFQKAGIYYEKAMETFRHLVSSNPNPQAYEPYVARALNNLANLYSDTQRLDESEAMYKEALEIRRCLAASNPQAYEPDVATTLNNLANLYYRTQHLEESEAMYKEALKIRRHLATSNPQAYEPDVAAALNNLAYLYSDTQRLEESEAMYKDALEIRRRLAASKPQAYEPDVAQTLNNLAGLYYRTQHLEESEAMYKEALEIRRRLAAANPQAYEPDVAQTLNNLAILYSDTQRLEESETMYKEALEIRRRLAESSPQAYEPDLAQTLNNMALLYSNIQRFEESEAMYKEALEIRRRLATSNPQAYEPDVADVLNNLASLYINTQRLEESKAMFKEALEIYRRLAMSNPQAYKPLVASTLGNMSFNELFLKKYFEAEQLAREGLLVDSTINFIATNLAAALLFQGKYAEAEAIYRQYKDEFKDGFLNDFKQFAEAGVIPEERKEDVERIKRMLNEP